MKTASKVRIIACLVAAATTKLSADIVLEGCADVGRLQASILRLVRDWNSVTPAAVAEFWPEHVSPLDAPHEDGSGLYGTRGRVIHSACECCDVFDFATVRESSVGAAVVRLSLFQTLYSTESKATALSVGRRLVEGALTGANKRELLGQAADVGNVRLQWEDSGKARLTAVQTQVTRSGKVWTFRLTMFVAAIVD